MAPKSIPLHERFHRHVSIGTANDCWLWTGAVNWAGYGMMSHVVKGQERHVKAHRISWEIINGPIPDGLVICHRCDVPQCVNPAHLFLGTHADNVQDKITKGRGTRGEQHGQAKLTPDAVRAIRESSENYGTLAAKFGISRATVCYVRQRKRWRHVL